jgi:alpha-beta hydrolase superfamily lysophospholipase
VTAERHRVPLDGGALALVLHLPPLPVSPCVVACHGLGASKDSDKYALLGEVLPAAGLALARFDFRGCGESTGVEEETTIASRIEDVETILAFLARHPRLDGRFGLHEMAAEPCELLLIPGGDHRLTDPTHRRHAVAMSRQWLLRFLG